MNTETFVGSLHKQKEVLQQEQQIFLFTEFTWQDEKKFAFPLEETEEMMIR